MISGEVQKRDLKVIDNSCPSRQFFKVMAVITLETRFLTLPPWTR